MIGAVLAYSAIVCAVSFAFAIGLASVYFWHDERKRWANLSRIEAKQRAVYVRREACTYESATATINIRKGK